MKKRILITLLIIICCMGLLYAGLIALSSQDDIYADRPEGCIGMMPIRQINPIFVEAAPGVLFRLDTGSDVSSITENDLETLRKAGYEAKKSFYPVIGRDGLGKTKINTTRYTVTLPLHLYVYDTDSVGNKHERLIRSSHNDLHNVDFVPSETGFSVLGIDFLERFKVEYQYDVNAIGLYFSRPEGYQDLAPIKYSLLPSKTIWLGHRYYMDLTIDRKTDSYFLDTGLQYVHFRLPSTEVKRSRRVMKDHKVRSTLNIFDAKVDHDAWMEVGNRAGTQSAYYYDTSEESYAFNPFNLFDQDVLIDFGAKSLALKPFCVLPKRHFTLRPDTVETFIPGI